MDQDKFSVYRMENNTYLGDSLAVVYHVSDEETKRDGLTGLDIAIYIKTPKDISKMNSVDELRAGDLFDDEKSIILRVASECQFGVFGDSHCDCESQRTACLEAINSHGQGIYVQVPQEGQGRGLHYKARELQLQLHGTDPSGKFLGKKDIYEASRLLTGSDEIDIRNFSTLKKIFNQLGLTRYSYILASSNPQKATALADEVGINILGSQDVQRVLNIDNVGEYLAKIYKKSFKISDDELRKIYDVLFGAKSIPERVASLLRYIDDDLNLGREFNADRKMLKRIATLAKNDRQNSPINMLDESSDNMYREYQVEIAVSNDDIRQLFKAGIIKHFSDFAFEQNYFYDLVYLKNTVARDLKIRRKTAVDEKRTLLESRLVYKTPVGEGEYEIISIAINDREVADLLANSLEGYEVFYVPVFTHMCGHEYGEDVTILVKRYSDQFKTVSIMGPRKLVDQILEGAGRSMKINIVPDPTHIRTINKDLSLDFEYDKLAKQELDFFNEFQKVV